MRQGQQNHRRGRGRGRKGHNPLARVHESNGPDVKVRGTASHIAEKYMALARDATSSGDLVMAENYLQHAEHYNRIIMAAQAQARAEDPNGLQQGRRGYDPSNMMGDGGRDDGGYDWQDDDQDGSDQPPMAEQPFAAEPPLQQQPRRPHQQEPQHRYQDQPRINELPSFIERPVFPGDRQGGADQPHSRSFEPRQPRHHDQDGGGRFEGRGDGGGRGEHRGPRRRGRHDNGGRQRMQHQDRSGAPDVRSPDVNGAAHAEPAPRDVPDGGDAD